MLEGAREFEEAKNENMRVGYQSETVCINRSADGIENESLIRKSKAPKLIVTSPPYPGVHVLYHRWQIHGRRETAAPYWIANCQDGKGESYYTFGGRNQPDLKAYYETTNRIFTSLAKICDERTMIVQLISFSDPTWQLPKYLTTLEEAGFTEVNPISVPKSIDGRVWRTVPNRKFYADYKKGLASQKEVLLFHMKRQ